MEDCFIFWSVGWLVLSPRNSIHLCVLLCRVLVVVLVLLLNYIILLLCDSRWLWSACFRSVCVFVLCTSSRFISNRQLIHQVHSKSEREDIPATQIIIILIVREDQDKFFCFNTGEEEDDQQLPRNTVFIIIGQSSRFTYRSFTDQGKFSSQLLL